MKRLLLLVMCVCAWAFAQDQTKYSSNSMYVLPYKTGFTNLTWTLPCWIVSQSSFTRMLEATAADAHQDEQNRYLRIEIDGLKAETNRAGRDNELLRKLIRDQQVLLVVEPIVAAIATGLAFYGIYELASRQTTR